MIIDVTFSDCLFYTLMYELVFYNKKHETLFLASELGTEKKTIMSYLHIKYVIY